jgi:polygalacturonase
MKSQAMSGRWGFAALGSCVLVLWPLWAAATDYWCPVREYGAAGNGVVLDTAAIQSAIEHCHSFIQDRAVDRGHVVFDAGTYLTGTIELRSNIAVHLNAGATILGALDPSLYTKDGLIYAEGTAAEPVQHISITGQGTIDGNGPFWWVQALLGGWRPQRMIKIVNAQDVTVQGVHLVMSPRWTLHLLACDRVLIDGVTIDNITDEGLSYLQTDGIDLEASRHVKVQDCHIEAGDDAIAVKNSSPAWPRESYDITIRHCELGGWANGFKIGTNARYDVHNVTFRDSTIHAVKGVLDIPLGTRHIAGVAIIADNTANVYDITVSNILMKEVQTPFFLRRQRRINPDGSLSIPGELYNIVLENITVDDATLTSSIMGVETDTGIVYPIGSVTLRQITVVSSEGGFRFQRFRQVPERDTQYPDAIYFGKFPAYGLYARHVDGLLQYDSRVSFSARAWWEGRPEIVYDDVHCVDHAGLAPGTWVFDRTGDSQPCQAVASK